MRRVREKAAENDVVVMTKLHHFKGFVWAESVVNQNSWPTVGAMFGLRIKHSVVSGEHNSGSRMAAREVDMMSSRRGMSDPIAVMSCRRPDDEWRQTSPIRRNTLNGGYQLASDSCSSILSRIILEQYKFSRGQLGQEISCFIRIVDIFCQNSWTCNSLPMSMNQCATFSQISCPPIRVP